MKNKKTGRAKEYSSFQDAADHLNLCTVWLMNYIEFKVKKDARSWALLSSSLNTTKHSETPWRSIALSGRPSSEQLCQVQLAARHPHALCWKK